MRASEFNPEAFPRGGVHRLMLEVEGAGAGIALPVLLVRGERPGHRLVATAAVHGDEYEGVRAIHEVVDELDPSGMTGDLLACPVANPPAFWSGTRTSPLDGANLARVFPGSLEKGPSDAVAHALGQAIIAHADLYIDLHSGGVKWRMPSMVGYYTGDSRSAAAARAFGARVLWGHPVLTEGRTISFAWSRGIPWLYTEARGAGRIHAEDLAMMKRGLRNLLAHLEVLPSGPGPWPVELHLHGDGNVDKGLSSTQRGFFMPAVEFLDEVTAGQVLGRLIDPLGATLETYTAPVGGRVALLRQFPVVEQDEPLFLIAQEWRGGDGG
ncbi:MAG: hypothetical protein FJW40_24010 [Acidobacteria bacterium]|nr:hypothetical protein [Acidobacteriota bacterium]